MDTGSLGPRYCKQILAELDGIDEVCICGGCPATISFQVIRLRDGPTMLQSLRIDVPRKQSARIRGSERQIKDNQQGEPGWTPEGRRRPR